MCIMSVQPHELLRYLPDFRVIVCTSCQYALQPSAISRHLKDIHHILRSRRKPFVEYASTFVLDDPDTVIRSTVGLKEFPVPALPVYNGLQCTHEGCSHLCVSEKRMRNHWAITHDGPGRPGLNWSSAPLQTFFRGNSLRYFTKPSPSPAVNYQLSKTSPDEESEAALMQHYVTSTSLTLADGIETRYSNPTVWISSSLLTKADAHEPKVIPASSPDTTELSADIVALLELSPGQLSIWQESFPQLAEKSVFLRQGILACSALHLAYVTPVKRQSYLLAAARHQELAMPLFREAIANVNADNCNAILAFIHILVICSFVLEQENERLLLVDTGSPDLMTRWLYFLRSGCDYVHDFQIPIEKGPLKPLLCQWKKRMVLHEGKRLPWVSQLLEIIPSHDADDAWSERECQTYCDAVHELGDAFVYVGELGKSLNTWDVLRIWPKMVSLEYLQLVHDSHPGALVVLAHYCRLLHKLDGKWYFAGRAMKLWQHILQRLDSKWHAYAEWPME